MAPSRRLSNGRSPLVNQQRQITSFFSKTPSSSPSPSPSSVSSKQTPKSNPRHDPSRSPSPSPSPTTPSPVQTKQKKPLLVIGPSPTSPSTPVSDTAVTPRTDKKRYGKEVLNKRLRVHWPLDHSWYEGCVKLFDEISGKHLVLYDDAEEELLDLGEEKIEWVQQDEEQHTRKFRRLRRVSVIDDEEEAANPEVEDGGDDSSDEEWGNNIEKEAADEDLEDMDMEDEGNEVDGVGSAKGSRGKLEPRKRKVTAEGKLDSCKKSKNAAHVEKTLLKVSFDGNGGKLMESTKNSDSK